MSIQRELDLLADKIEFLTLRRAVRGWLDDHPAEMNYLLRLERKKFTKKNISVRLLLKYLPREEYHRFNYLMQLFEEE